MAIAALCVTASLLAQGSPVGDGLELVKQNTREELKWLEGLQPAALEDFFSKHCPATLLLIQKLSDKLAKAPDAEKEGLRQDIAGLVDSRASLYRDLEKYQTAKQDEKVKTCLLLFVLEDQKVLAEAEVVRMQAEKAKAADLEAKQAEVDALGDKIDDAYDKLDKK